MPNRIFNILILGGFFLLTSIMFISCQEAKDTIGVIIVKDSNGNTVSGATVVLHQDDAISQQTGNSTNPELRKTNITDENGRAEFTYELEAIFQVDAEKIDGNNIYSGSNMIRLLREKTVTQVVEIN